MARVRARELDLGLIAGHHNFDGLEVSLIEEHPLVAWGAKDSPIAGLSEISWSVLLDLPLVMFLKGFNQRTLADETALKLGKEPDIVVEGESPRFLGAMVASGHGVSVVLSGVARQYPDTITVPIVGGPSIPFWLCRRQNAMASIAARAFYDHVRQALSVGDPTAP